MISYEGERVSSEDVKEADRGQERIRAAFAKLELYLRQIVELGKLKATGGDKEQVLRLEVLTSALAKDPEVVVCLEGLQRLEKLGVLRKILDE